MPAPAIEAVALTLGQDDAARAVNPGDAIHEAGARLHANATDMPADLAVTAWGRGALFESYSTRALDAIRASRDRGPELVP